MINRVVLVGRLTKVPELKYTQSGIASCRFTLAVNRAFKNAAGEQEADFVSCVAWRKQAENMANFLKKGSLIGIEGRIQTGSYEDQDGKKIYTTEVMADSVQFLEPKNNGARNGSGGESAGQQQQQQQAPPQQQQQNYNRATEDPFSTGGGPVEVSDDDLPF